MKGDKFMIWVPQKLTEVSILRLISYICKPQKYVPANHFDPESSRKRTLLVFEELSHRLQSQITERITPGESTSSVNNY